MIDRKRNGEKRENMLLALLFTGLFFFFLSSKYDFYYDLNDDTAIRDILSGIHTGTPSAYSIQMLYPLSWLLSLCYRILPNAPVFGAFLCLCQYGSIAMLIYRGLSLLPFLTNKPWFRIVMKIVCSFVVLILMVTLFLYQLVFIQYSVVSGCLMITACFYVLTSRPVDELKEMYGNHRLESWMHPLPIVVMVVLSYCIRTEVCMMLSPFFALAVLIHWSNNLTRFSKEVIREYGMFIGALFVMILLLAGIDTVAYKVDGWNSFNQLFDARTQLYDYIGIPDEQIAENEAFYSSIGLKKEEVTLLHNYNYALDGNIDTSKLKQIVAYRQSQSVNQLQSKGQLKVEDQQLLENRSQSEDQLQPKHPLYHYGPFCTTRNLSEAIYLYKQQLLTDVEDAWYYSTLIGYALILILGSLVKKSGAYWKVTGLFAFRTVIWIYLLLGERTPARITVPLHLAELIMLAGIIAQILWRLNANTVKEVDSKRIISQEVFLQLKEQDKKHLKAIRISGVAMTGMAGLAVASVIFIYIGSSFTTVNMEAQRRSTVNPQWQAMQAYCNDHPEQYFLIDVYSTVQYTEKMFTDVDNSYRNYDLCGGWLAKSPLTAAKLQKAGITNAIELDQELASNPNLFFISNTERDITWLSEYYNAKNISVEISAVSDVDCFTVYQVIQK